MDEWEEDEAPASQDTDAGGSGTDGKKSTKAGKRGAGRGKAKAKGKARSKKAAQDSSCFLPSCQLKKSSTSKFCQRHNSVKENMRYQAEQAIPPQLDGLYQVLADPSKAELAVNQFMLDNPDGVRRKRLIDWVAFKRTFGVKIKFTVREGEELLSISDFFTERARDKTRVQSDAEFNELAKDLAIDREGEGPTFALWLPKKKTTLPFILRSGSLIGSS